MEMCKKTKAAARAGMAAALACGLACGLAATAEAKTAAPAAPTSVRAIYASNHQICVGWKHSGKKEKKAVKFKVVAAPVAGGDAVTVKTAKKEINVKGLKAGTRYSVRVKAKGKGGKWSKWSKAVVKKTSGKAAGKPGSDSSSADASGTGSSEGYDKDALLDEAYESRVYEESVRKAAAEAERHVTEVDGIKFSYSDDAKTARRFHIYAEKGSSPDWSKLSISVSGAKIATEYEDRDYASKKTWDTGDTTSLTAAALCRSVFVGDSEKDAIAYIKYDVEDNPGNESSLPNTYFYICSLYTAASFELTVLYDGEPIMTRSVEPSESQMKVFTDLRAKYEIDEIEAEVWNDGMTSEEKLTALEIALNKRFSYKKLDCAGWVNTINYVARHDLGYENVACVAVEGLSAYAAYDRLFAAGAGHVRVVIALDDGSELISDGAGHKE